MAARSSRRTRGLEAVLLAYSSSSISSTRSLGSHSDHRAVPPSSTMPLPHDFRDPSNELLTPPPPPAAPVLRVSTPAGEFVREGSQSAAIMEDMASPRDESDADDDAKSLSGHVMQVGPFHVRLGNGAQRLLSALALAPLITYFLWRSPAFATTTVCALVVSVSCYEYAWLAHRIHSRFVFALDKFEAGPSERASHSSSTRSLSFRSNGPTQTSSGRENGSYFHEPLQEEKIAATGKRCAVTKLADKYCCGSEWLAAAIISMVGTAFSSSIFTAIASCMFPSLDFGGFRIYYSIISSFSAWLCACLTPDWRYATLLIVEKEFFTALTVYSMKCPINNLPCNAVIQPPVLMLGGIMAITVFRVATTRTAGKLLFHLMLDLLGFVYIIGSLFFIVSFVDLDREATYRKLVIALLYVVWASDSGAYFFGKLLEACHYQHSHPLASHLSARKDYEGTFVAIFFGVGAMFLSSYFLHINGSVTEKLFFAAVAVIVGRIGDLFESLLKRAAMVKDSGTIIPGHGGVLDRIDALMFASVVFSRYFGAIILPDEQHL